MEKSNLFFDYSCAMKSQIVVSITDSISRRPYALQVYMSFHDFLCDLQRMLSSQGGLFSQYPSDYYVNIVGYYTEEHTLIAASNLVDSIFSFREFSLAEFQKLCSVKSKGAPIDNQSNNALFEHFLRTFTLNKEFISFYDSEKKKTTQKK